MFDIFHRKVEVYAASSQQPPIDRKPEELGETEAEVHAFFSNPANVDKLISFLSLEEKKGRDKFNGKRYILFKVNIVHELND
jgi:proteasome activator subunit 4